jgi:hypothetical protein
MSPKDASQMNFILFPYETIENKKSSNIMKYQKDLFQCQLIFVGNRRSLGLSYTDLTKLQRQKKPTNTV